MKEALALAGGGRRLSAREEELLGLLAGFPDGGDGDGSDRELSFSDLIEAGACRSPPSADADPREDRPTEAAVAPSSPGRNESAAAAATSLKRQRQREQAARQRARRSAGSRGSCGGGGDGVLLNFYVPGLLTRSMTTPRPASRGPPAPGAVQGAPAKPVAVAAVGKPSRKQTALGIGCWTALWGRGRRPAKACS